MTSTATRLLLASLILFSGVVNAAPASRTGTFGKVHGDMALVVGKDWPAMSPISLRVGIKLNRDSMGNPSCLKPWLRCTAFGGVETRLWRDKSFHEDRLFHDDPTGKRRTWVSDVVVGLRLDFPRSRTPQHGPWFMQFKVTRRSQEIRSSIPVPRRTFAAVTVGTDF